MPLVNLRNFYPFYKSDCWQEVPQDVLDVLMAYKRAEHAYQVKVYRHKAYYSLDVGDGIEGAALPSDTPLPQEIYERKETIEQLRAAFSALTPKQTRRIYDHYILGMTFTDIARKEGVDSSAIRYSIRWGLKHMAKILSRSK